MVLPWAPQSCTHCPGDGAAQPEHEWTAPWPTQKGIAHAPKLQPSVYRAQGWPSVPTQPFGSQSFSRTAVMPRRKPCSRAGRTVQQAGRACRPASRVRPHALPGLSPQHSQVWPPKALKKKIPALGSCVSSEGRYGPHLAGQLTGPVWCWVSQEQGQCFILSIFPSPRFVLVWGYTQQLAQRSFCLEPPLLETICWAQAWVTRVRLSVQRG